VVAFAHRDLRSEQDTPRAALEVEENRGIVF
jgi:hypothetical protein